MITQIAIQERPDTIIWARLSDGKLISCTRDRLQDVAAWARHFSGINPEDNADGEEVEEVLSAYSFTWISENAALWGVPFKNEGLVCLDIDDAVNIGGGIVGLPYSNAADDGTMRFVEGDVVIIEGTTNYDGLHTLTSGTSVTQLQFADTYNAETFNGDETVLLKAATLSPGPGRMIQDSNGVLYYGHNWSAANSTYVTIIDSDGDVSYWTPSGASWPIVASSDVCVGLKFSADEQYLYILVSGSAPSFGYCEKYNYSTGALEWRSALEPGVNSNIGFELALDDDDNAYFTADTADHLLKCDADTGAYSIFALSDPYNYGPTYGCKYDSDNNKLVLSGRIQVNKYTIDPNDPENCYNLVIVDASTPTIQTYIQVGGYYTSGNYAYTHIIGNDMYVIKDNIIYILCPNADDGNAYYLWKYAFDGTLVDSSDISGDCDYPVGLFIDSYGNIVVVNVDWVTSTYDRFYFYDTSLNYLNYSDNVYSLALRTWDASAGGAWMQGNAYTKGELGASGETNTYLGGSGYVESVCVIPGTNEDEVWVSVVRIIGGKVVRYIEQFQPRGFGDQEDAWFVDSGISYDSTATQTFTGLDHLEGETVSVLGDGQVLADYVVSDGEITITEDAVSRAIIGLPFTHKLKPMRFNADSSIKRISEIVVSFENTLNTQYGENADDLYDFDWRVLDDLTGDPVLFTGMKTAAIDGGFSVEDNILISGNDPVPCNVRGIVPRFK